MNDSIQSEEPVAPQPETSPTEPGPVAAKLKAAPVTQRERIVAIDVLRGVALLGILIMNIKMFASVFASYGNPTVYVDSTGANWWVWVSAHVLADLKMMTIFSMLFGAGIILMASRLEEKGLRPAGVHYRRMLWLLLIGMIHAYLIWNGDILVLYALCGMMVYIARRFYAPIQIAIGLLLILFCFGINMLAGLTLDKWPAESLNEMQAMWNPTQEQIDVEIAAFRGTWLEQMPLRASLSFGWQTGGFLFFGLWRIGGVMLLGMGLFKLGVFSAARSKIFYITTLVIGLAVGLPLILMGLDRNIDADFAMESAMFINSQFNYFGSLFMAMSWTALVMLIVKGGIMKWLTGSLSAVGQMAFTNYLMQSVICTTIFYGHGFGLFGKLDYLAQFYIVLAVWAFQLIVSPLWLARFRFGPLEWLWRSLTYWKSQPMRRAA